MNKYQEALKFLKSDDVTAWGNDNIDLLKKHLEVIKELVEKSKPKKVNLKYELHGFVAECPNCHKEFKPDTVKNKAVWAGCPHCLQKIEFINPYD